MIWNIILWYRAELGLSEFLSRRDQKWSLGGGGGGGDAWMCVYFTYFMVYEHIGRFYRNLKQYFVISGCAWILEFLSRRDGKWPVIQKCPLKRSFWEHLWYIAWSPGDKKETIERWSKSHYSRNLEHQIVFVPAWRKIWATSRILFFTTSMLLQMGFFAWTSITNAYTIFTW